MITEKCSILPHSSDLVPRDIALECHKIVYPRVAPRSSVAIKNTDVGAEVIDGDYRRNLNVLIQNHSTETLNIEAGNRIAQVVLTRYETPDIVEVNDLEQTSRASDGFGSSGI